MRRRIPENRTLEFKQDFPFGVSERLDFLQDVTAMANADGGTIIYGVAEGAGDDKGLIVRLIPLDFKPDERQSAVINLLRDGVEEQIPGILHKAIRHGSGYLYVVRVPQSRLAPHMVTVRSTHPRFYLRANTSNDPMNVQQIKDVVLRSQGADERVRAFIESRTGYWRAKHPRLATVQDGHLNERPSSQVLLHILPLFPPRPGLDLASDAILQRFAQVPPLYCDERASTRHRMSLDGYANELDQGNQGWRRVTLLRTGGLEFHAVGTAYERPGQGAVLDAWDLEQAVLDALGQAAGLSESGLVALPVAVSLRLMQMGTASLYSAQKSLERRELPEGETFVEPVLLNEWAAELESIARSLFDVVWQSWGWQRSWHYANTGARLPFRGR